MLNVLLLNIAHCSPLKMSMARLSCRRREMHSLVYKDGKTHRKSGVPAGQSFVAQLRTRTRFPVQYFPPFDGGGSVHSL